MGKRENRGQLAPGRGRNVRKLKKPEIKKKRNGSRTDLNRG